VIDVTGTVRTNFNTDLREVSPNVDDYGFDWIGPDEEASRVIDAIELASYQYQLISAP
jgi:hypothetical protein